MASFPKIESPCPLRLTALPDAGKNYCSMCERKVHNLSAMTQFERSIFMRSCTGKVCVAYSIPVVSAKTVAMAGVGLSVAMWLGAGSALAGDTKAALSFDPASQPDSLLQIQAQVTHPDGKAAEAELIEPEMLVLAGGISLPQDAEWVDENALTEGPIIATDTAFDDSAPTAKFGADPANANDVLR